MKVLILSCNTGEGHNSAARAVEECIQLHGQEAEKMDVMMLGGKRISKYVGGSYVWVVKHTPRFFNLLYRLGSKVTSSRHKSPVYYANALLAKRLEKYIKDNDYDMIVTTHLFPAETLSYLKQKKRLEQHVVAVQTDYTCIPFWEETDCDYYIIPHEDLLEEYVGRGIPKEKLLAYGIPVRQEFSKPRNSTEARKRCKLPEDCHVFLIMSGSMGFGKIQLFVGKLRRSISKKEYIVVVCGTNKKLYRILKAEFGRHKNVKILGYTNHIASYMDASDVLFTKPGGLTSTEAAVKGIPIIHTEPIPGCETKNRDFFEAKHMSVASSDFGKQIREGFRILHSTELQETMRQAQSQTIPKYAAEDIYQLLLELCVESQG